MFKNNTSIVDDRGYNQGFKDTPSLRKRMERRADWMLSEMEDKTNGKVLEIGCGTGCISYCIAQKSNMKVVGTDLCKPFIDEANEAYKLSNLFYQVLDFNKAANDTHNKFDYLIGNGILHHLYYNLDNVLVTFKKILNPGGKIIFMEPNIYNPYVAAIFKNQRLRRWARLEPDEMAFSKKFIKKKLQESEFKKIKIAYKDFLLPGIPEAFISPSILAGHILERTPLKYVSQSILITAVND
jgi:2-polyprenyl-3-methyl-5-hydroxy-6-metoxy-1,4-benzoquinol methylase